MLLFIRILKTVLDILLTLSFKEYLYITFTFKQLSLSNTFSVRMPILQKFYRSTVCILVCVIVLRLADSSSITNLTTILIMTKQHLEYKKPGTSTPAKVQNNGKCIWTINTK